MHQSIQATRTINRRRYFRREQSCEVQIQALDAAANDSDACSHYCISHDVSPGGVRLIADHPYPLDSRVLLTMECRENGWSSITSRVGSVVWARLDSGTHRCQLGICFTDIDLAEIPDD